MTLQDINSKISSLTTADTNQYANSDRLIDINIWLQKIIGMILDSQDETDFDDGNKTDYPIKTTPLTTNRDYAIPVSEKMLKIKSLSIAYDGTNFYRATPVEFSDSGIGNSTSADTTQNAKIDASYSRTSPRYDIKFGSVWIYPAATAADVAAGGQMIMEWFRQATPYTLSDLTTGTLVPGFDDTFHAMLAYGPASEYCLAKGMEQANDYLKILADFEARLRTQYSSKQLDRKYSLQSDYQTYK
jgi:hypothetical protein